MFKYAKPTIPLGLLHDIEELEPGGSYDQLMDSLRRLAALPGDYKVCPGHDALSTLETERKSNYYMREALGQ